MPDQELISLSPPPARLPTPFDVSVGLKDTISEKVIENPSLHMEIWKNSEERKRLVDGLAKTKYVENMEAQFVRKDGKIKYGLISAYTRSEELIGNTVRKVLDDANGLGSKIILLSVNTGRN